jgi:hypothetical protein
MLDVAIRTDVDSDCAAAVAHIKGCDSRFVDSWLSCTRTRGSSIEPEMNKSQSQCVQGLNCFTISAAITRGDYICGLSLAGKLGAGDPGDRPAQEARKPFRPDEKGD